MKHMPFLTLLFVWGATVVIADQPEPQFEKMQLSDKFHAEGAYFGDFNRDGALDVVAGPFWYEGPDFQKKHEYRPVQEFDPKNYSDNFLTFVDDFNADDWPDVLVVGWPGKDHFWFENPAGAEGHWKRHLAAKNVGNESPVWGDIDGDGQPDLLFNMDGRLGYATFDTAKPDQPWTFHAVSPGEDKYYFCYTHGMGFGDLNGDGRTDIVESRGWWEQPADVASGKTWPRHPFHFADAAAQMLVYDVNGDGLNDVVTAWHSHLYGLVWYEQTRDDRGNIAWQQHVLISPNPDTNSNDLRISQLHAFAPADVNGDGLQDFVTGKRFWAHGPTGDVEPDAPAVVYWFELQRDDRQGARFIPHQIDDDSGVGTQVASADLNGDGTPDVIVSNKKGTFLHLSRK